MNDNISETYARIRQLDPTAAAEIASLYPERFGCEETLREFISNSPVVAHMKRVVCRLAAMDDPVLICGETGTGKELIARALHEPRSKSKHLFVGINCTSLPDYLLESELFGHVKGAFTGAESDKVGLFEHAKGGTVFLDEIGDMPLQLQAKLLRVLQEKTIRKVGGVDQRTVDCRIVSATHRDLLSETQRWESTRGKEGFRPDLYWRIATYIVCIPPLRERVDDIDELLDAKYDIDGKLSEDERSVLRNMPLHGNVRELEALVKRKLLEKLLTT